MAHLRKTISNFWVCGRCTRVRPEARGSHRPCFARVASLRRIVAALRFAWPYCFGLLLTLRCSRAGVSIGLQVLLWCISRETKKQRWFYGDEP